MGKYRSPFTKKPKLTTEFKKKGSWKAGYHTGEDWVCSKITLVAPCDGVVLKRGSTGSYGNHMIMKTFDGKCILMAHMKDYPCVKKDQKVKKGEVVGYMGATGNAYGAHLHIEVEDSPTWSYNKNLLKPSDYIDFGVVNNYTLADARKIIVALAKGDKLGLEYDANGDGKVTLADARKIIKDLAFGG